MKNSKISNFVEVLRKFYQIGRYPDYVEKMCNECDIECFKLSVQNDLLYEQINFKALGITEPFHRASLLGIKDNNIVNWYLIDPTYGQFFENKKFKDYMFNNYHDFSIELLINGYIECNSTNLSAYFSGFVYSDIFGNNKDKNCYNKINELCLNNNINCKI